MAASTHLRRLILACALTIAMVIVAVSPCSAAALAVDAKDTPVQIAAYRWVIKPENIDAYAKWLNRPDMWAEDFSGPESWNNVRNPEWLLKPWGKWVKAKPGRKLLLGVPLLAGPWDRSGPTSGDVDLKKPVSLQAGARGEYDAHFKMLAESLVKHGLGESILRLGWEFNGGWHTWRAGEDPAAFAEYWRHIVETMRGVEGAKGLTFCWNPSLGDQQFPAEKAWPGDEYVDYIGLDVYDESWNENTYPFPAGLSEAEIAARQQKVWKELTDWGGHGLRFWTKFSQEHKKPLAFPEWGVNKRPDGHGGLDNPYFIEQMHAFITDPSHHVAFHCYFDVEAPDGAHQLSPGPDGKHQTLFPKSAERFKALFSGKE
jgi:hypothetical protein